MEDGSLDLSAFNDLIIDSPDNQVDDRTDVAAKFAFIGAGQAGGRIVDTFYSLGYRRVIAFNTTEQDFVGLQLKKSSQVISQIEGGAGKDMKIGKQAALDKNEELFNAMSTKFRGNLDKILVCIGAGGGTGSGSALPIIHTAKRYLQTIGHPNPDLGVGCIVSLPKRSEGTMVHRNAFEVSQRLLELVEKKQLSPLIIIDNERLKKLLVGAAVTEVWGKSNLLIAKLFDVFNVIAAQRSKYYTFDAMDYKTVLDSGIVTCGVMRLDEIRKSTDIASAVKSSLSKSLYMEGLDLTTASVAAGIVIASSSVLDTVSEDSIDLAFETLASLMSSSKNMVLHRGVYEGTTKGLYIYTMIGGASVSQERIKALFSLGGH